MGKQVKHFSECKSCGKPLDYVMDGYCEDCSTELFKDKGWSSGLAFLDEYPYQPDDCYEIPFDTKI